MSTIVIVLFIIVVISLVSTVLIVKVFSINAKYFPIILLIASIAFSLFFTQTKKGKDILYDLTMKIKGKSNERIVKERLNKWMNSSWKLSLLTTTCNSQANEKFHIKTTLDSEALIASFYIGVNPKGNNKADEYFIKCVLKTMVTQDPDNFSIK